ncbi:hypothetical protein OIU77_001929, partial [Salix suchowensis]
MTGHIFLEFIESSRISNHALFANSPSKLCKIYNITTNSTFITMNPSYKANNGERTIHFVGKTRDGIWTLH